jgi:hypothetical protein
LLELRRRCPVLTPSLLQCSPSSTPDAPVTSSTPPFTGMSSASCHCGLGAATHLTHPAFVSVRAPSSLSSLRLLRPVQGAAHAGTYLSLWAQQTDGVEPVTLDRLMCKALHMQEPRCHAKISCDCRLLLLLLLRILLPPSQGTLHVMQRPTPPVRAARPASPSGTSVSASHRNRWVREDWGPGQSGTWRKAR